MEIEIDFNFENNNFKKLESIFEKYIYNLKKMMAFEASESKFKKRLEQISTWSEKKQQKEYEYALKYIAKKAGMNEAELKALWDAVYINAIRSLVPKRVYKDMDINIPSLQYFWYKLLKNICKKRKNEFKYIFISVLPLKKILQEFNTESKKIFYDFTDVGISNKITTNTDENLESNLVYIPVTQHNQQSEKEINFKMN